MSDCISKKMHQLRVWNGGFYRCSPHDEFTIMNADCVSTGGMSPVS